MSYLDRDSNSIYQTDETSGKKGPGPQLMGAETLIGNAVSNHLGESLGEINEIMLDMSSGKIAYAVLTFGDFMGMGGKLFAVPWSALQLDTENKSFSLAIEKSQFENSPGFAKDDWPDMANQGWAQEINDYYGVTSDSQDGTLQVLNEGNSSSLYTQGNAQERRQFDRRQSAH